MVLAVHGWVLLPALRRLTPAQADPRLDLSTELFGWPSAVQAVRDETVLAGAMRDSEPVDLFVVGPHWVICAQLEVALGDELSVGCDTPMEDDFDGWSPRDRWRAASTIVWVTDNRFGPPPALRSHVPVRTREVRVERGGRTIRTFAITTLVKRAVA
jgi:hypothetical protein